MPINIEERRIQRTSRDAGFFAGLGLLILAGVAVSHLNSVAVKTSGLTAVAAAHRPNEGSTPDQIIVSLKAANDELSRMAQHLDFSMVALDQQKAARAEIKNLADLTEEALEGFDASWYMRDQFRSKPNVGKASLWLDSVLPLLDRPKADRKVGRVAISPEDPLDSPMRVVAFGPYGAVPYSQAYADVTVGDQIYWTAFYNLERAQDEVRKELGQFVREVNAEAARQQEPGIRRDILARLDYAANLAAHKKRSAALAEAVADWRGGASDDLKTKADAVSARAFYDVAESSGTDRGVF